MLEKAEPVDANPNEPEYFHRFEHLKITRTVNGILEVRFTTNDGPIVFTGKDHHDFVEAFSQIAQDRDNDLLNIPELTRRHMRMMFVAPLRKALLEQVGYGLAVEGISATDLKRKAKKHTNRLPNPT